MLRDRAHDCLLRARALADRADPADPDTRQFVKQSDTEAICARVLLELAEVEDEDGCGR